MSKDNELVEVVSKIEQAIEKLENEIDELEMRVIEKQSILESLR